MKVTVLVGGVGGARFLLGLRELFGPTAFPAPQDDASGAPGFGRFAQPDSDEAPRGSASTASASSTASAVCRTAKAI